MLSCRVMPGVPLQLAVSAQLVQVGAGGLSPGARLQVGFNRADDRQCLLTALQGAPAAALVLDFACASACVPPQAARVTTSAAAATAAAALLRAATGCSFRACARGRP